MWGVDPRPMLFDQSGNLLLQVVESDLAFPLKFGFVHDTRLAARVYLQAGSLILGARHSAAGDYHAQFNMDGTVSLFRGSQLLASGTATQPLTHVWAELGFEVIGNRAAAYVNGIEVVSMIDSAPLPYGTPYFASGVESSVSFWVESFLLSGVINASPSTVLILPTIQPAEEPILSTRDITELIVYERDGDIYVINPNGTGAVAITSGTVYDGNPKWSYDRRYIAFESNRDGGYGIWIFDYQAYLANPSAVTPQNIYITGQGTKQSPAWSANDYRFIFSYNSVANDNLSSGLYVYTLATQTVSAVNLASNDVADHNWSPNGDQIVFSGDVESNTQIIYDVATVNLDGSNLQIFTNGGGFEPDWSVDGLIVYQNGQLRIVPSSGGTSSAVNNTSGGYSPSWSPNGEMIVFVMSQNLYVISACGTGLQQLTFTSARESQPDWGFGAGGLRAPACHAPTLPPFPTPVVFRTNTPIGATPIPTTPPTPAPTFPPSLTPVPPTATLMSPAELATVFPLPMQPNPTYGAVRLSGDNLDFIERDASNNVLYHLCSRDANPSVVISHPLISPANAEIWLSDIEGDNQDLGKFTVIRIPIQNLPQSVRNRLLNDLAIPLAPTPPPLTLVPYQIPTLIAAASTTTENVGWIYIAYAHQDSVTVATPASRIYTPVDMWQSVGASGNTGIESNEKHLDVSAFYVSGTINNIAGITTAAGTSNPHNNSTVYFFNDYNAYSSVYKQSRNASGNTIFGYITLVDPLTLWPFLKDSNFTDPIDYLCP